jgi:hypothetical protein
MNKILKSLGAALQRHYSPSITQPMDWRMIDAVMSLEEAEEKLRRESDGVADGNPADANANEIKSGPGSNRDVA